MLSIEKSGKTIEEALTVALKELRTNIDSVNYKVLEKGSRGFFGLGAKPAKVFVEIKFNPVEDAVNFLREVCIAMGLIVEFNPNFRDNRYLDINLAGENMGILIGKRGQTLDALQYLTNLAINKGTAPYVSVNLDTENYRVKRKETLENLARNLAKKAKQTKKEIVLEPMESHERRIIHSTLQNDRFITTYSQGDEPYRNVVIAYKNNKK